MQSNTAATKNNKFLIYCLIAIYCCVVTFYACILGVYYIPDRCKIIQIIQRHSEPQIWDGYHENALRWEVFNIFRERILYKEICCPKSPKWYNISKNLLMVHVIRVSCTIPFITSCIIVSKYFIDQHGDTIMINEITLKTDIELVEWQLKMSKRFSLFLLEIAFDKSGHKITTKFCPPSVPSRLFSK